MRILYITTEICFRKKERESVKKDGRNDIYGKNKGRK
jgi:hypothetical protein